jgi:hypothetical protein
MSYVSIPPAYYADMRPGTPYHPGGRGWLHAWVDGWGENPNVAWPSTQAAHGIGDAAPGCTPGPCPTPPAPPFSYVGEHPFSAYFRPGNAPWGQYPQGPAYAIPRPNLCPGCIGMPIAPGVGALRGPCGDCEIDAGNGMCTPCPPGVDTGDYPECANCGAGGVKQTPWYASEGAEQVMVGVLSTLGAGLVLALLHHESQKKKGA